MKKKNLIALFLFALAVFFLCYNTPQNKKYQHQDGFIFGTVYSVTYTNPDNKDLAQQINNALEAVNNSLSMFNPQSTISKINNNQAIQPDSLFLTVWETGQHISNSTEGAFDMTIAPLVDLWGFGLKNREQVTDNEVDSIRQYVSYKLITLKDGIIHKTHQQTRIDAGAIAKGYACDIVADTLTAYGCSDFCIEIGGEIVVKGLNSKGVNWHIAINKPIEDSLCVNQEIQEIVELTNCGMATSGNYRNYYELNGKKYSHTINPHTGYPVRHNLLSATIIAPDCITADAWATACMVAGLEKSQTWINNNKNLKGYLIYEENGEIKTWKSENF